MARLRQLLLERCLQQLNGLPAPLALGFIQRRRSPSVFHEGAGPGAEQRLDDRRVALGGGEVERRPLVVVPRVARRARLDVQRDQLGVLRLRRGAEQARHGVLVDAQPSGGGAMRQEHVDRRGPLGFDGLEQRRGRPPVLRPAVRPSREKDLDRGDVALGRGDVEGGPVVVFCCWRGGELEVFGGGRGSEERERKKGQREKIVSPRNFAGVIVDRLSLSSLDKVLISYS